MDGETFPNICFGLAFLKSRLRPGGGGGGGASLLTGGTFQTP